MKAFGAIGTFGRKVVAFNMANSHCHQRGAEPEKAHTKQYRLLNQESVLILEEYREADGRLGYTAGKDLDATPYFQTAGDGDCHELADTLRPVCRAKSKA